jgi:glutaredoxin-related protein
MEVAHRILRYLKGTPEKGFGSKVMAILLRMAVVMQTGQVV